MPFPRFEKLAPEKRERLLEAAAREFAAHGFAAASINRILDAAQMSKGAAYYYFADKADLFGAVIAYCGELLQLIDQTLDVDTLTPATYWPAFTRLHREPLVRSFERPWLFAALKAAGRLDPAARAIGSVGAYSQRLRAYVAAVVRRGQQLSAIRRDLPDTLLMDWMEALDRASDDWLLAHWHALSLAEITSVSDETVEAMRRAVAPPDAR